MAFIFQIQLPNDIWTLFRIQIIAYGGRVPGYGFAGDTIDRVYQLMSKVVGILSCGRPVLTLKTTVLKNMADEYERIQIKKLKFFNILINFKTTSITVLLKRKNEK